ncbi:uncharacterized protein LOC117315520 isoform X1 [Pecten maximus]|uniref:uncharacterized protein LOC117315520 isoform X1 n=1 Tax=Pecten maximus TaxID=6579 RepID=UPI001458AF3F|nr:uncharacterized protein LOC117315520 isoform X1 [Pecten maximus]
MACHVMAVYLLVAIVGVFVSSTAAYTHPKRGFFLKKCPRGTIPAIALLDPAVGTLQLSCRKAPVPDEKCVLLGESNPRQSSMCPPNFSFRGLEQQRPICCKLKGIATTDCFRPKVLYSFALGFEISIPEGFAVVGRFNYGVCTTDPTVFQIKICKLTPKMAYPNF